MATTINDKILSEERIKSAINSRDNSDQLQHSLTKNTSTDPNQILLHSKFIIHNTKAGLNPLVDSAAYLFSNIGKLNILKSYRNLNKLQKELIDEINTFQETAKLHGYSSESILVARYALCATIDDIISNVSWGNNGQWNMYRVLSVFNQESPRQDRFFIILERITKDPVIYIDIMEFMYICLSLGYKGSYRKTDSDNLQLEKITHGLYKHIRAYRGDFSKTLSPFVINTTPAKHIKIQNSKPSYLFAFFLTASIIMLIFISLSYTLDTISNSTFKELISIGKTILYETNS